MLRLQCAVKYAILLVLLPFYASSQFSTAQLDGQLYGEQIVSGPCKLTSGCNGIGGSFSSQTKFVATAKSIYKADNSNLPGSYSKKWEAPAGRSIKNINVKKHLVNDSCWQDDLLILLDNGGVYVYDIAAESAVSYGKAGTGNPQAFFKIGGNDIQVLSSSYIYTTHDSGLHWQVDTNGLNSAIVNDFDVDTLQRIFAATNRGIYKKAPADTAWSAVNSFTAIQYVSKIYVDRSNRVYNAGGGNALIYVSNNDGANWVADSLGFGPYVVKQFADDAFGNIYAVANTPFTTTGDKIYISANGTAPWHEIDGTLTLLNANPVFINSISGDSVINLGTNLGNYFSTDLGTSWTGNNTGIQAEYVSGLVQLQNGRLIAAVSLGIYKKDASDIAWQKTYPANGYANGLNIYSDSSGTVYLRDPNITPYLQQATPVLKSTDNGDTWQHDFAGLSNVSGNFYFVDETGTQHYANSFYAHDIYSLLWAKPTGGSWAPDTIGFPVDTNSAVTAMASNGVGSIYVSGYLKGGGVWRRNIDTGSTWSVDTTGLPINVSGFYKMAGGHGIILGSSLYQIFIKSGNNWVNVPFPGGNQTYHVSAISVDNNRTIFASFINTSNIAVGVYYSNDTGATWKTVGLDSIDVISLVSYGDTTYALTSNHWAYKISPTGPVGIAPLYSVLPIINTYPEPFSNTVAIQYYLPAQSLVTLKIYNTAGQELIVMKNEMEPSGNHILNWNGEGLPNGIYYCKMLATGIDGCDYSEMAKMVRLK